MNIEGGLAVCPNGRAAIDRRPASAGTDVILMGPQHARDPADFFADEILLEART